MWAYKYTMSHVLCMCTDRLLYGIHTLYGWMRTGDSSRVARFGPSTGHCTEVVPQIGRGIG